MPDAAAGSTTDAGAQGATGGGDGTATGAHGATDGTGAQGATGGQSTDGTTAGAGKPQTLAEALLALEEAQTKGTELASKVAEREAENARYREQRRQAEADEEARRREGMSSEDQLKADLQERDSKIAEKDAELAQLRDQLAGVTFVDDVTPVAQRLGFRSPRLAADLLQRSSCLTADGKVDPAKVEQGLRARLTADPYLASATGTDAGAGREGAAVGTGVNEMIRTAARR